MMMTVLLFIVYLKAVECGMDYSTNPNDAPPPGYSDYANAPSAPYGQSTLLHGDDNTGPPPNKPPSNQPEPGALYPPSGPSQYPDPPGYAPAPYGAPPYGYPMGPGYPPPGYGGGLPAAASQQQQSVVVIGAPQHHRPMWVGVEHVQSYIGHIVLACFVTWCCCFIFGLIAFILAGEYRRCRSDRSE